MVERNNSAGVGGMVYGDEGKGSVAYRLGCCFDGRELVFYRDHGGAGTGHGLEFADGSRFTLHLLPVGVFLENTTAISGKGMVLHPGDLVEEIRQVKEKTGGEIPAKIMIDEMAVLSLDTHRAFEFALRQWHEGGKGSTGRGIAPAYADILLRHPLRMRDLIRFDEKIENHYRYYEALLSGLGLKLSEIKVPSLSQKETTVGSLPIFLDRLEAQKEQLLPYTVGVFDFLKGKWADEKIAFVFEKAQAVGLDPRWGVYPDVTASDTTFANIYASTEGIVNPAEIKVRAGVMKATYMSSVGTRKLPTITEEKLAQKIREDAHEYGATTRRPRDIAYLDLPALKFFAKVGNFNCLVLTHMDIVYPDTPVKVCYQYEIAGKAVPYRPDQEYLNRVTPKYIELSPWSQETIKRAKTEKELPFEAGIFLDFIALQLGLPILMITTGPRRDEGITFRESL